MGASKDDSRFVIDIDRSRSPGAFEDEQNLWRTDLQRIYRLIEHQATLAGARDPAKRTGEGDRSKLPGRSDPPKLAIAIFGPSGSGKSSLLRTLRHDIERGEESYLRQLGISSRLFAMPVMDPTTWSSTDQFLYAFLASALEVDRSRHEKSARHSFQQGLSRVQLAFQDVNEYLQVLDDLTLSEEPDPLGMSLRKLERHSSGLRLREKLTSFVDSLCRDVDADLLLLPVDDLDMAPDHLVNSLNVFQSFLASPRLVPIFTFTDRMPEELIEAYYQRRLVSSPKPAAQEGTEQRRSIGRQLALQFLARCFPVRNRILLGPAPARVQRASWYSVDAEVSKTESSREVPRRVLDLLTIASFLLFGHPDREDAHRVRAALRPSTLRRQLQVFDAMVDSKLFSLPVPYVGQQALQEREADQKLRCLGLHHPGKMMPESAPGDSEEQKRRAEEQRKHDEKRIEHLTRLAEKLKELGVGATWGRMFNHAAWSLLNVHRDTLRELGLYLEDLQSWTPVGLRGYVLEKVLARDQVTRRELVDRWFNRADFRRSQVLSLLVANSFRPWMIGEEPYGDEERAVIDQRNREAKADVTKPAIDSETWEDEKQIEHRLTIRSHDGLRWFLGVTLGFYLPLTMARDWKDALPAGESVRGRMSGSGWDLAHAPINAIRVADAKRELLSFGMHFLAPEEYGKALAGPEGSSASAGGDDPKERRQRLLLRIWTCCGYSYGRYWAAISLWRGLSFIGQVLEAYARYGGDEKVLSADVARVIRSHCLLGLVPGSLLGRGPSTADLATNEELLEQGFPAWRPEELKEDIDDLSKDLQEWLKKTKDDVILPFPVEHVRVGWKDCFVRRVHGEYILGSLWPRLHSAYLEEQRSQREASSDGGTSNSVYRWSARVAASTWTDLLLEYWRGCPPILWLLLSCPAFVRSEWSDSRSEGDSDLKEKWLERLSKPVYERVRAERDALHLDRAVVGASFDVDRADITTFLPPAGG